MRYGGEHRPRREAGRLGLASLPGARLRKALAVSTQHPRRGQGTGSGSCLKAAADLKGRSVQPGLSVPQVKLPVVSVLLTEDGFRGRLAISSPSPICQDPDGWHKPACPEPLVFATETQAPNSARNHFCFPEEHLPILQHETHTLSPSACLPRVGFLPRVLLPTTRLTPHSLYAGAGSSGKQLKGNKRTVRSNGNMT